MKVSVSLDPEPAERLQQEPASAKRSSIQDKPYRVVPHSSGFQCGVDVGKLNSLVDELEVEEFQRPLER